MKNNLKQTLETLINDIHNLNIKLYNLYKKRDEIQDSITNVETKYKTLILEQTDIGGKQKFSNAEKRDNEFKRITKNDIKYQSVLKELSDIKDEILLNTFDLEKLKRTFRTYEILSKIENIEQLN